MKEIERRYLLKGIPKLVENADHDVHPAFKIKNLYLPTVNGTHIRCARRKYVLGQPGYETYKVTIKQGHGLTRQELEHEVDRDFFKSFSQLDGIKIVKKVRTKVKADQGLTWEVDVFKNRELFLAEIEIPEEGFDLSIPRWLKPYIIREVTEEKEYEGASLAL